MFEPGVKQVEAMTVAYKLMRGAYGQTPHGLGELYGWLGRAGLAPQGMPQAVYLTMPETTPEDEAMWELWAPVSGDVAEREPDEHGLGIKTVPEARVASLMYQGPYEQIAPAYETLFGWIIEQGFVPGGPPRELYYSDPSEVPPAEYLTEIQMPIV